MGKKKVIQRINLKEIKDPSFLSKLKYSDTDIQDFIINYHLMYNNFDDLFEGDAKFYGTAQDFLKRAKEVQASGVPYANEESDTFAAGICLSRDLIYEQYRNKVIDNRHHHGIFNRVVSVLSS